MNITIYFLLSFVNLIPLYNSCHIRVKKTPKQTNILLLVTAVTSNDKGQVILQAAFIFTEEPEHSINSNERRLENDGDNKNGHRSKIA